MSSIVYLRNSKSNTVYAYLNESVWDPEKRKNVYKRKCIGHVDPETGEIIPNRMTKIRDSPVVKSRYLCKVLDKVSEEMHLTEVLKLSFPDDWKLILSLAYYSLATGEELTFCKQWSVDHKTPYNQTITVETMNNLLSSINSNNISLFFTLWKLRIQPEETYTSSIDFGGNVSSMNLNARTDINVNEFNNSLMMTVYYSTKTNVPICYQLFNKASGREIGDYDVSPASFSRLSTFLDGTIGAQVDPSLIPYADSNITVSVNPEDDFVIGLVEKSATTITNPSNYRIISGIPMFIESYMQHVNGRIYFVHIFFDPNLAVSDLSSFISIINICKYEVEMSNPVEEHQKLYDDYLIINEDEFGRKTVELNSESILNHNKYFGYNVLVSSFTRNASNAVIPFLQRNNVAESFDSLRNEYDNTALNLFTDTNHQSRIFIQFISLILTAGTVNVMNSKKLNKTLTLKEMVHELSNIKTVKLPNVKKTQDTFLTDQQIHILDAFDISYDD